MNREPRRSTGLTMASSCVARSNQSALVFACFFRAEDLMSTTPGEQLSAIVKAREESAARLGQAANVLPAQLSKLLSEALSLPPTAFATSHR